MNRPVALLLPVAIAAAVAATACHRDDDAAARDAAAAMPPAVTTPSPADASPEPMGASTASNSAITDADFYGQALDGGRKEVAAATLASTTASDAAVKSFADMLVRDHTAMNEKVLAASGQADAAAPAPDATATADLQGKTGEGFDRAFVDKMVSDHQAAIALFENASRNAGTEEARALARDALPRLRAHLQTAQELQGKLGGT